MGPYKIRPVSLKIYQLHSLFKFTCHCQKVDAQYLIWFQELKNSAHVLKEEGNELFRCGSYKSAIKIYSRALRTCPLKFAKDRSIMYSNRAVCKMKLVSYTMAESRLKFCHWQTTVYNIYPVVVKCPQLFSYIRF